ncbi:MAG: GAF domain-containing protein [Oceanospirillaceae bacterium]|nr:GAF domain-containing protein [Oceanospirillaceae bacterium]
MDDFVQETLLKRLLAISRAIAGQLDYQSALRQIAGEVHQLFKFDHMDIAIILSNGKDSFSYEVGVETQWGQLVGGARPIVKSPIRALLLGEVPHLLTGDAIEDDRFHFEGAFDAPIYDAKLRSRVHVPLYVNGALLGALSISNHKKNFYSEHDIDIAKHIADLLAPFFYALSQAEAAKKAAIAEAQALNREEMLRLGALRLTQGMEQERKRLGMDLHDQTLAELTRLLRHLSRLRLSGKVEAADLLLLEEKVDTCLQELRNIIEDTKPGVLDLFGFAQGVEAQLERSVAGITPAITTVVVDKSDDYLDTAATSQRTTIFRIVQEAINNAVKHSRPSFVRINIAKFRSSLRIEIIDDGGGISTDAEMRASGIENMKARAALVSSKLSFVNTGDHLGTQVVLDIPLNAIQGVGDTTN